MIDNLTYFESPDEITKLEPTTLTTRSVLLLWICDIVLGSSCPIRTFLLHHIRRWSVALGCTEQSNLVHSFFGDDDWEYLELSAHLLELLLTHLH